MSESQDGRGNRESRKDREGMEDNVIYANFTTKTRVASAAETGPAVRPSRSGVARR